MSKPFVILSALLLFVLAPGAAAQDESQVTKGLEQWAKAYRANKIDFGSRGDIGPTSIGRKADALPKGLLGVLTAARELEAMLDVAAELGTPKTLLAALAIAAVDQDDVRYKPDAMPHSVRRLGEAAVARFTSAENLATLEGIARDGAPRAGRGIGPGMQAAALRALGTAPGDGRRELFRSALENADADVRAGAADALAKRGTADDLHELGRVLRAERDGVAIAALGSALAAISQREREALEGAARDAIADAAVEALGRSAWRVDMVLVDLLESVRSARAIPGLIGVLDRFLTDQRSVKSGALSGVLRHRAHEALLALTGAAFPMDDPARWRTWWDDNQATLTVSAQPAERSAGDTSSGFFGIPVRGTRVVFIVDLSGSMTANIKKFGEDTGGTGGSEYTSRLVVAQKQVWDSIQRLEEDAMFDVIAFSQDVRAWEGKLVPATDANKKKARRFIDEFAAKGGTNLWGGMMKALEFQHGSNATTNELELDELFLLSDGAPTVGEVINPREILRMVTEANRSKRVRINTVFLEGVGSTMDPDPKPGEMGPAELMQELARENGGVFVKR